MALATKVNAPKNSTSAKVDVTAIASITMSSRRLFLPALAFLRFIEDIFAYFSLINAVPTLPVESAYHLA